MAERLKAEDVAIVGGNLVAVEGAGVAEPDPDRRGAAREDLVAPAARAGDLIAVTGFPGRAGAGARLVSIDPAAMREPELGAAARRVARAPSARRVRAGAGGGGGVRAAIDLSDGFAADLGHLCEASAVGAEIEEARLAERSAARSARRRRSTCRRWRWRFGPSDDYELILAVDPSSRDACEEVARTMDVRLSFVGRIADAKAGIVRCHVVAGGARSSRPRATTTSRRRAAPGRPKASGCRDAPSGGARGDEIVADAGVELGEPGLVVEQPALALHAAAVAREASRSRRSRGGRAPRCATGFWLFASPTARGRLGLADQLGDLTVGCASGRTGCAATPPTPGAGTRCRPDRAGPRTRCAAPQK